MWLYELLVHNGLDLEQQKPLVLSEGGPGAHRALATSQHCPELLPGLFLVTGISA